MLRFLCFYARPCVEVSDMAQNRTAPKKFERPRVLKHSENSFKNLRGVNLRPRKLPDYAKLSECQSDVMLRVNN